MNVFRLLCVGAIFVFSCAAAAPSLTPAQKSAICGKRSTCKLVAIHNAGKAQVAEVLFGIKDKPDDAPDDGCRTADGNDPKNGGTEYWLLDGGKPANILSLCNDGYGAADVGEDTVTFSNNRMVHVEAGGSSWRWDTTDTISLVPFRLLTQLSCSYHNIEPATGTVTLVDAIRFRAADIRKNPAAKWDDNEDDIGCPEVKPSDFAKLKPVPGAKLVADYPVPSPSNVSDPVFGAIPGGTMLGSCAMVLSTDGANGFLTFGKPADSAHAASMKVLAVGSKRLLLQIYDPIAAPAPAGKSWIGGAHAEIWHSDSYEDSLPPDRSELRQVAVDLDGTVHLTGEAAAPQVKRWTAQDEKGRPVTVLLLTWADDVGKTAVSYSQAENGRQARLVANVAMARGVPMVMPSVAGMPTRCTIHGGRFEVGSAVPQTSE